LSFERGIWRAVRVANTEQPEVGKEKRTGNERMVKLTVVAAIQANIHALVRIMSCTDMIESRRRWNGRKALPTNVNFAYLRPARSTLGKGTLHNAQYPAYGSVIDALYGLFEAFSSRDFKRKSRTWRTQVWRLKLAE